MTPGNALQAAIYTRLSAQLDKPVYDYVPQDSAYPYVVIGADTLVDWGNKSTDGWETTLTIHVWDDPKAGRKSVKSILGAIFDALHGKQLSIPVTGFALVSIRFEFEETFQDDERYYHGVQRYRALVQAT